MPNKLRLTIEAEMSYTETPLELAQSFERELKRVFYDRNEKDPRMSGDTLRIVKRNIQVVKVEQG